MKFKNKKEMFLWIWENRPHVSELSGKPLLYPNHPQWYFQFLHVLNVGRYKHWEFNPDNILLGLPEEHVHQDTYPVFKEKQEELTREYYREFYGKEF